MKSPFFNNLVLIALLILVSAPLQKIYGLQVEGLYSYQVMVDNESDSERSRAFQEAFKAVILKVTGDRRWLDEPAVEQAIANAQSYVEVIQYGSRDSTQFSAVDNNDLQKMNVLRRIIAPMGTMDAIEFINSKLKNTKNNAEFFNSMNKPA